MGQAPPLKIINNDIKNEKKNTFFFFFDKHKIMPFH
jgi:hypothetical protein